MEQLETSAGFVEIGTSVANIVYNYSTVEHISHSHEILRIWTELTAEINQLNGNRELELLYSRLNKLRRKVQTIIPHNRSKRRLPDVAQWIKKYIRWPKSQFFFATDL